MELQPSLSVIIPSFQRRASLQRILRALCEQTLAPDQYEVIAVTDGSTDGSREMVADFTAPYALEGIWQENRGRAAACNTGIRAARGNLVVLFDDDKEYPRWRWLRAALIKLSGIHPGVPEYISRFIVWLERRRPAQILVFYQLALDYFYWLGVDIARREPQTLAPASPVSAQLAEKEGS